MVGEAIRVGEDAAADHKAVDFKILLMKFERMSAVTDVAVDDEFGFRRDLVAEFDDIRYEFIMGGDFAHFLLGAKVNGEGIRVFGE